MALPRLTDRLGPKSGTMVWLALRWYPVMLISYSSGIAAVAAEKYENLATMFMTRVASPESSSVRLSLALALGDSISELEETRAFKALPGHERNFTPRSEYLLKLLQPDLDELLFLGGDYESSFDKFEVMLALVCADLSEKVHSHAWGPIGRFGWKYARMGGSSTFGLVTQEASTQKDLWPPLRAGLFDGSYSRFEDIATKYESRLKGLSWH